ncbi:MAG: hypothetical protein ACU84H_07350 [Gammaproteobacteria bacterium]
MSAQLISARELPAENKLAVSFRLLFSLYAIIPICLLLQLFDGWFWQGFLKENLPSSPTHFLLFQILFGTPHIVASAILLAGDREYVGFYKWKIMGLTIAAALVFGIGSLFIPYLVLYLLVACWTVFHVLKQQHGIARGICRLPNWAFNLLLGLSVTAGIFIYVGIFLKNSLNGDETAMVKQLSAGLSVALVLSTVFCQRYVTTRFGKWFLWSNTFLVLSSFYLYAEQYYLLAILVPRLVHDATAYIFYVAHDYNKHHGQPRNTLYRIAKRCHLPIVVVLPVLSFGLAFILQAYGDSAVNMITDYLFGFEIRKAVTVGVLGYLALLHYYSESFTWKQDSPYRRFIAFSR